MREPPRSANDFARMALDLLRLRATHGRGFFHLAHSFSLHVLTGLLAVAAHYSTMYAMLAVQPDPLIATTIGFVAGGATRFVLSFFRVFAPTIGMRRAGARFLAAIALQALANAALLALLMRAGIEVWPAQVATTVALAFVTYAGYRLWVFR